MWLTHRSKVYYINKTLGNFCEHRTACRTLGMDLLILDHEEEAKYLADRIRYDVEFGLYEWFLGMQHDNHILNTIMGGSSSSSFRCAELRVAHAYQVYKSKYDGYRISQVCGKKEFAICAYQFPSPLVHQLMSGLNHTKQKLLSDATERYIETMNRMDQNQKVLQLLKSHINISYEDDDGDDYEDDMIQLDSRVQTETILMTGATEKSTELIGNSRQEPQVTSRNEYFTAVATTCIITGVIFVVIFIHVLQKCCEPFITRHPVTRKIQLFQNKLLVHCK